jgi:hypothetical protein
MTSYFTLLRWSLGYLYIVAVTVISYYSGTLDEIFKRPLGIISDSPPVNPNQLLIWVMVTFLCICFSFIAYWIVWTGWTNTNQRKLSVFAIIFFGVPWGFAEGLITVSIWRVFRDLLAALYGPYALIGCSLTVASVMIPVLHNFFLDRYVLTNHNYNRTNGWKVLYCHVPFLVMTICYLTAYESLLMAIMFEVITQAGSIYGQHFPAPWFPSEEWPTPDPSDFRNEQLPFAVRCEKIFQNTTESNIYA